MSTVEPHDTGAPTRTPGAGAPASWEDADWDDDARTGTARFLGVPVSLDPRGLRERAARHYSPTDPLLVPRAWGIGWDLNLGALAVRTGWTNPDDLGDDLRLGPAGMAALSAAPAALAVGSAIGAVAARKRALPTARAASASSLAPAALMSTALGAVDIVLDAPLPQRLGHATTSILLTGAGFADALRRRGGAGSAAQAAVVAGAAVVATALAIGATRAAISRAMRATGTGRGTTPEEES